MLAGRVNAPGPYGWHGESEDLVKRILDGFALHRWRLGEGTIESRRARAGHLAKFVREGLVPPDTVKRELTEEEKKGKSIFESEKAQCSRCHVPGTGFTDRVPIPVGEPPVQKGFAQEKNIAYKTPSLMFVRGTAPYFHDGRYESLLALVEKNPDTMGKTMHLSAEEKKALVAYLETL
jgi:cytochrome c peroxidase